MLTDRELLEVIRDFRATGWTAITLADDDLEIRIIKRRPGAPVLWQDDDGALAVQPSHPAPDRSADVGDQGAPDAADEAAGAPPQEAGPESSPSTDQTPTVDAGTVGIFWEAPAPGAEPFVKTGDVVEVGQQLAIVEVMKLMTDVLAEHAGTIEQVLVENGQMVEAGQALFRMRCDAGPKAE